MSFSDLVWKIFFTLLWIQVGEEHLQKYDADQERKEAYFSTPHHSSHSRKRITMHWSRQIRFLDRSTVLIHLCPNLRTKLSLAQNSDQCTILLAGHIWSDYVHILAILVISAGQQYLKEYLPMDFVDQRRNLRFTATTLCIRVWHCY